MPSCWDITPESTKPRSARNGLLKAFALQKLTRHTATPLWVLRNHLVLRRASIHSASSRVVALRAAVAHGPNRTIRSDLDSHYAVHWQCQPQASDLPEQAFCLQPVTPATISLSGHSRLTILTTPPSETAQSQPSALAKTQAVPSCQ
jgi:hypothetical protein